MLTTKSLAELHATFAELTIISALLIPAVSLARVFKHVHFTRSTSQPSISHQRMSPAGCIVRWILTVIVDYLYNADRMFYDALLKSALRRCVCALLEELVSVATAAHSWGECCIRGRAACTIAWLLRRRRGLNYAESWARERFKRVSTTTPRSAAGVHQLSLVACSRPLEINLDRS